MRNTEKRRIREAGFTIMELAAVLGIIAVLAALSVPTYNALRRRAYEAEARSFIQEIRVAAWEYYLEKNAWPQKLTDIEYDADTYTSKYFSYSIGPESGGTGLVITATGLPDKAAAGIVVQATLSTTGELEYAK
ncbi:MAG TPA: prepilin-type N-terminal cleavage/methylation domain-containing protein [Firmicutes bacterium]|nr:prepilin-type N-terminal cleavage/methylation domain-containing protein [Candidatus Fermentithermobacillaceae bacterium]